MKKILLAAAMAAACGVASAQGYVGALVGLGRINADCGAGASCDKSDTAFKVYGGYGVTSDISVELGYTDFGSYKLAPQYQNVDISAVSLVGAWRGALAADWTGVARLGLASVKAKWDTTAPGSKSKAALYAGLGVEYTVSPEFKLTGMFDLTQAEVRGDSGSVYLIGVGAQMGF